MTPGERYFYDRGRYAEIASRIDRMMKRQSETECTGGGCDGEGLCEAHFALLENGDDD